MMLRKSVCALLAGAILCTGWAALPTAAIASEYQLGDVDMNGKIDPNDAMLTLRDFVRVWVLRDSENAFDHDAAVAGHSILTDEQRYLADVFDAFEEWGVPEGEAYEIDLMDASIILQYYVYESVCDGEPIGVLAYWENVEQYRQMVEDADANSQIDQVLQDHGYAGYALTEDGRHQNQPH